MKVIYNACSNSQSVLITPDDINRVIDGEKLSQKQLESIINDLAMDGYFELVFSSRQGETVYCITISEKGKAFNRSKKMQKRNIIFRVCLTVSLAILSFVIGLILKAIF